MIPRPHHPMPPAQQALLQRAVRLELVSIGLMGAVAVLVYLAAGQSQTMKTAWIEDVLSLVAPIAFLVATRFAHKPADAEYVNGRVRAYDIAFLVSAVALTGVGIALVYDGLHALLTRVHPTVGSVELFGQLVWQGWLMMAALVASALPPAIIARFKLNLARQLYLKPLHTDADTGKADWMTGLAGVAGIAGIGMGLWWADAVAALVISGSVLHDGVGNLRNAIRDLHDARPETIERAKPDPLVARVREAVEALDWVMACEVRLHEEGMRLSGLVVVEPRDERQLRARLREAAEVARAVHWRLDELVAVPAGQEAGDEAATEAAP